MKKKVLISIAVVFVSLTALVAFFSLNSTPNITEYIPLVSQSKIVATSDVPDKPVTLRKEETLDELLSELEIFTVGVRDLDGKEINEIDNIQVIYTSDKLTTLTTINNDQEIISASEYDISGKTLTIRIYVDEELVKDVEPYGDVETEFNIKLVQTLVAISPVQLSRNLDSGKTNSTTIEQRQEYFLSLLKKYFGSSNKPDIFEI